MEIKDIKLSPKKGGHGHITSYSINLGSAEVRSCGFLGDHGIPLANEKIIDPENHQIIIRLKSK